MSSRVERRVVRANGRAKVKQDRRDRETRDRADRLRRALVLAERSAQHVPDRRRTAPKGAWLPLLCGLAFSSGAL